MEGVRDAAGGASPRRGWPVYGRGALPDPRLGVAFPRAQRHEAPGRNVSVTRKQRWATGRCAVLGRAGTFGLATGLDTRQRRQCRGLNPREFPIHVAGSHPQRNLHMAPPLRPQEDRKHRRAASRRRSAGTPGPDPGGRSDCVWTHGLRYSQHGASVDRHIAGSTQWGARPRGQPETGRNDGRRAPKGFQP